MKQIAQAAERNKDAILEVLQNVLPPSGLVLEVGSGTGQHVCHFARALPNLEFLPSDANPAALASIEAYLSEAKLGNVRAPVLLDARASSWPVVHAAAVIAINVIHIAPWAACTGLLAGGARVLPPSGPLVLYGPFSIGGDFTAESNVAFDARLRTENPEWGVRELDDIEAAAARVGLVLDAVIPRPKNNHVVVFRRGRSA